MDKTYRIIVIMVVGILSILAVNAQNTQLHEEAHGTINRHYGIKYNISYAFLMQGGVTTPVDVDQSVSWVNASLRDARAYHLKNDIEGYSMLSLEYALLMAAIIIAVAVVINTPGDTIILYNPPKKRKVKK